MNRKSQEYRCKNIHQHISKLNPTMYKNYIPKQVLFIPGVTLKKSLNVIHYTNRLKKNLMILSIQPKKNPTSVHNKKSANKE